ncbi:MAG: hypothetical protein EPN85_06905 [Bacteroidetes bacterium]|nr:MAG: hypothetical protein EPN85_06905 [Bacteroidota bacterium]
MPKKSTKNEAVNAAKGNPKLRIWVGEEIIGVVQYEPNKIKYKILEIRTMFKGAYPKERISIKKVEYAKKSKKKKIRQLQVNNMPKNRTVRGKVVKTMARTHYDMSLLQ